MKLLVIGTDRNLFDPESAVRARVLEQAALVDELHVVVLSPKGEQFKTFNVDARLFVYPTSSSGKFMYLPDAFRIAKSIIQAEAGSWLISTQDPFEAGVLGYLLARKLRTPLHLQLHTDPFNRAWQSEKILNRVRFMIMLFLLRHADGVRVVSERVFRAVVECGVAPERITRVPIFVDTAKFRNATPTFNLRKSYPEFAQIVLSMGRLQPEKNYHGLIRAFAAVLREHPDALLIIVGSGPERERLVALAHSLDISAHVKILPWARDVSAYYRASDVYVQPSLYEGWGMAVIEAMASGVPVVMTNVGCAGELVRNEETGLVVKSKNVTKIADAIIRLLGDEALRRTLSRNALAATTTLATKEETHALYKASWEKAAYQLPASSR